MTTPTSVPPAATSTPVTVVVPVYGGVDDVRRCLHSVVRHGQGAHPFDLRVIDDASPEPDVATFLAGFAPDLPTVRTTVVHNPRNLGFVKTCGQAMRYTEGDVVLLNSDTVVTEGWLDRLIELAGEPDTATVTPLTNFGSLCTLPSPIIDAFDLAGPAPRIDECAAFVLAHTVARRPEVISGVGFCMYITRAALDRCGSFDEDTFGSGYGEEVDFCLRASSHGFRHVVDDRTFVYHRGGVSFSERREEGLRRSREIIHRRYPFFRSMNLQERDDDPLSVSFAALELGLAERQPHRRHVLQLLHSKPGELGGTEKHFWRLTQGLLPELDVSVLQPCDGGFLVTTSWLSASGAPVTGELLIPGAPGRASDVDDPAAAAALETTLDMFDFDAVHLQNIVHHSLAPLAVLADFDGPVACSVRDLYLACPHHWLLYRNEQACGIPDDLSYCARCLPETRQLDVDHLDRFRATVAARLDTIDHWVFASRSAVDFLLRVYDLDLERIEVIEHGAIIDHERVGRGVDVDRILHEPLRIAFVGIGWAKKGLPAVNELAEALADSSIEIHHFGELRDPISPLVHEHGHYDNSVLPELLRRAGIHAVLLPGAFVETFGHVMTEALISGLPVIGNRHGALGERIRTHEVGWTIEPEDVEGMRELIEYLDRSRLEVLRATRRAVEVEIRSVDDTVDRYAALYRPSGPGAADDPTRRERKQMGARGDTDRLRRELRAMATVNRRLQVQLTEAKARANASKRSRPAKAGPPGANGSGNATAGLVASARSGRHVLGRARRSLAARGFRGAGEEAARRVARRARRALRR